MLDALLGYQVGVDGPYVAVMSLKSNSLVDYPAVGDIRPEVRVDCRLQKERSRDMSNNQFLPRIQVGPVAFMPYTNSPAHLIADLSVLNSCRRALGQDIKTETRRS